MRSNNRELVISVGKIMRGLEEIAEGYPPQDGPQFLRQFNYELSLALLEHLMFPPEVLRDSGFRSQISQATSQILQQLIILDRSLPLQVIYMNFEKAAEQYNKMFK